MVMASDEHMDRAEKFVAGYLAEYIGETVDPHNSPDRRYSNNQATVDVTTHAIYLCTREDRARQQLDELGVGERLRAGAPACYMKIDYESRDGYDYLKIEKARDC